MANGFRETMRQDIVSESDKTLRAARKAYFQSRRVELIQRLQLNGYSRRVVGHLDPWRCQTILRTEIRD